MQKTPLTVLLALVLGLGLFFAPTMNSMKGTDQAMKPNEQAGYARPSDEELKARLTPLQYHVTQEAGTEQPFNNEYWQETRPGLYVDIVTGEPLFTSREKYQSSCGWPAFFDSLADGKIVEIEDRSFGMLRTEVRSALGDTHLGHVFENDPESPNGTRYCINSASLRFIPLEEMEAAGYGEWVDRVQ